jgi:hypothetical protein
MEKKHKSSFKECMVCNGIVKEYHEKGHMYEVQFM